MWFAAEKDRFVPYSHSGNVFGGDEILWTDTLDIESGLVQTLFNVRAITAHVVILTVDTFTLGRSGDRGVLESLLRSDGNRNDCAASVLENAAKLAHGPHVVGHMFEHMAAVDYVECVVGVRNFGDIHLHHCTVGIDVARGIFDTRHLSVSISNYPLGRKMQHLEMFGLEQILSVIKKKPHESEPLHTSTNRTTDVRASVDTVGPE